MYLLRYQKNRNNKVFSFNLLKKDAFSLLRILATSNDEVVPAHFIVLVIKTAKAALAMCVLLIEQRIFL